MGNAQNALPAGDRVDFAAVKAVSLHSLEFLLGKWLPGGRRKGVEYVVTNPTRADAKPGSFSINTKTGLWSDFATGDRGGGAIDLLVYLTGRTPLEAAREISELLGVAFKPRSAAEVHSFPSSLRTPGVQPAQDVLRNPAMLPLRTPPDAEGGPRFVVAGDEGPSVHKDEKRRHGYKIGQTVAKWKIMCKGDTRAVTWYRVADADGVRGWQSRKPEGWSDVPFIGSIDPFAPDNADQTVFWTEGEKDTDNVSVRGLAAFTFGGTGDGLPSGCEEYVRDRHVVILADNDQPGIQHAEKKAALAAPVAASVRVVHFPKLAHKGDVSDFFEQGGTAEQLQEIVMATAPHALAELSTGSRLDIAGPPPEKKPTGLLTATAYQWTDPTSIPKRQFVYGKHLIRKFVSATIAPGGLGKSSLIVTEVMAMVSGLALLGVRPVGRLRVWLWNLEDPREEISRHIQATALRFDLKPEDLDNYLWVDSGRDQRLVTAISTPEGVMILEPVISNLVAEMKARQIDVIVVDPFVSSHEASENDNPAMDRIVKAWGRVAQLANCAVELVHHARKPVGGERETTVDSSRGGKALTDGCRSVRVLNRMTEDEGKKVGIDNPRSYFRVYADKANLAPPAEKSDWRLLESVDLGNPEPGEAYGDSVGVVVAWAYPDLMADVSVSDLRSVQAVVANGNYRADAQAADWVGQAIASVCKLDLNKKIDEAKAKRSLKVWINSGALRLTKRRDGKGNYRNFVEVGEWASD